LKSKALEQIAKGTEDVADVLESSTASTRTFHSGVTVLIVAGSFLSIVEHLEGLGRLFEPRHRFGISGIAIRMVLSGQLTVGFFELFRGRRAVDAENFIVVAIPRHLRCPIQTNPCPECKRDTISGAPRAEKLLSPVWSPCGQPNCGRFSSLSGLRLQPLASCRLQRLRSL
jgi:hypothetical protein